MVTYNRNIQGNYGPTTKGNFYSSKPDHRRTARQRVDKTRWSIEEGQEFHVFKLADEPLQRWFCQENECLFSLVNGCATILGQGGERLAKFPQPADNLWHGYPVHCIETENSPGDELLDLMVSAGVISGTTRRRIERKRL
jgi:hypothetical protein